MKHMLKNCFAAVGVLAFCGLNAAAVKPQPVKTKASPFFDAENKTFKLGNKQLIFADNGTFKVMSSGKCIATGHFFISTAFAGSQTNTIAKVSPGAYKGGALYVESCKADAENKTVVVKGKLPLHKRNTPAVLADWTQTAVLTADGKVDIVLDFVIPEGKVKPVTQGFVLRFIGAEGYKYGPKAALVKMSDKMSACPFTGPALAVQYKNKADDFSWEFPDKKIKYIFWHRPAVSGVYFSPHPSYKSNFFHVRFNVQ